MKEPILLKAGRGHVPGNPITSDIDLALILRELCGAEGYTIKDGHVIALRWVDGSAREIERYEIALVDA